MVIDLVVLGAVGLFALIGAFTGALPQLFHLAGLVLGWLATRLFGVVVGTRLAEAADLPPIAGVVAASLGMALGVYVAVWLVGRLVVAAIRKGKGPGATDRAAGVLLGGAKIGLLAYLLISLVVLFDKPLRAAGLGPELRESQVASLARRYNLLAHTGLPFDALQQALQASRRPGSAEGNAALKSLSRDPRVRRIARRRDLQAAFQRGDYVDLLQEADVLDLLSDPKIAEQLDQLE